jgi:hypothetical protein
MIRRFLKISCCRLCGIVPNDGNTVTADGVGAPSDNATGSPTVPSCCVLALSSWSGVTQLYGTVAWSVVLLATIMIFAAAPDGAVTPYSQ